MSDPLAEYHYPEMFRAMSKVVNPMTKSEAVEWIAALRSGKYTRGTGTLSNMKYYTGQPPERGRMLARPQRTFCCLGVEQKIHPEQCKPVTDDGLLQTADQKKVFRLPLSVQQHLAEANDGEIDGFRPSFKKIAALIEEKILPFLPD